MASNTHKENNIEDLIPRKLIFGNPDKSVVKISHDSKFISYIAPYQGVLNIYVAPVNDLTKAQLITNDTKRGIRSYFWAHNNNVIVYLQDKEGDENWHLYSVNVETKEEKSLTPFPGVRAQIITASPNYPDNIIVGLNKRRADYFDVFNLNLNNGELDLLYENDRYGDFTVDRDFNIRFAIRSTEDGGAIIDKIILLSSNDGNLSLDNKKAVHYSYEQFMIISPEDLHTTGIVGLNAEGNKLYLLDSRQRNTAGFFAYNLDNNQQSLIYGHDKVDVSGVIVEPKTAEVQAVYYTYDKEDYHVIDERVRADFNYLKSKKLAEFNIISKSFDDNIWLISCTSDIKPVEYYIYNRSNTELNYLFSGRKELENLKLAPMHSVFINARDGLNLVSYLTIPIEALADDNSKFTNVEEIIGHLKYKVPLVLLVHGGPTARDEWGLDPIHQWLANRGYAVLSVNYRGSTGFGKDFINAGKAEWAGKMHDDLLDAVSWAIEKGITTKDQVAIMGGSYGGYAALVGLTITPDVFACAVDIVGPSNLVTLMKSIPPYWKPFYDAWKIKVGGDPDTPEGNAILMAKSPINYVKNIKKPLLIGHGANDPRVKQEESEQIVNAMKASNIPVTYVLYPDEGHGFARPENRLSFYAVTESFLASTLRGKVENVGNDFSGSSIDIKHGKEFLPDYDGKKS